MKRHCPRTAERSVQSVQSRLPALWSMCSSSSSVLAQPVTTWSHHWQWPTCGICWRTVERDPCAPSLRVGVPHQSSVCPCVGVSSLYAQVSHPFTNSRTWCCIFDYRRCFMRMFCMVVWYPQWPTWAPSIVRRISPGFSLSSLCVQAASSFFASVFKISSDVGSGGPLSDSLHQRRAWSCIGKPNQYWMSLSRRLITSLWFAGLRPERKDWLSESDKDTFHRITNHCSSYNSIVPHSDSRLRRKRAHR